MKKYHLTQLNKATSEKRADNRRYFGSYPITIRKADGTHIKALLSNISRSGIQIKCNRISAKILTPKKGLLVPDNMPEVKISLILPFKKGVKIIKGTYKIRYVAVSQESNLQNTHVLGLKAINYEGNSFQVVKDLLDGKTLPILQSNVDPAVNF